MNDLGLEYVDLYLMHWPVAFKRGSEQFPKTDKGGPDVVDTDYLDVCVVTEETKKRKTKLTMNQTYKAMEKLISTGKVKAIGVSNFSKAEMERLLENATVPPAVHQLEGHPWLQQRSFADWHKQNNIHVTHYSPFGNQNEIYSREGKIGRLIEDPVLVSIAKKTGKTPAQVALGMFFAISTCDIVRLTVILYSLGRHRGPFGSAQVQDAGAYQSQLGGGL